MKKLILALLLLATFLTTGFSVEIFSDFFDGTNLAGWQRSFVGTCTNQWNATTTTPINGTHSAYVVNVDCQTIMNRTQDLSSYFNTSLNVSFSIKTAGLDAGECLNFSYSNGSVWTAPLSICATNLPYANYTYLLTTNSNKTNAMFSFRCYTSANAETCQVDNFRIQGTVMGPPPDTTSPNINGFTYNVTNASNYSATQGYQFNATITDGTAVDDVWLENNFTGTMTNTSVTTAVGSSYYYNHGKLGAGQYYLKWYANDTGGYLNNSDYVKYYSVMKANQILVVSSSNGTSLIYTNATTITGNGNLTTAALYENGTAKYSPYTNISAAGSYNYTWNSTGNANYTANSTSIIVNIAKLSQNMALTIDPSQSEEYGTTTTATGSGNMTLGDLYRNGMLKTNGESVILGAGEYNYTFNNSGNENYTANSTSKILTITKNTSTTTLYINGSTADTTYANSTTANLTGIMDRAGFTIQIWTNLTGTWLLWQEGASPLTNYTILAPYQAGNYSIIANWTGNENYTGSADDSMLHLTYNGNSTEITLNYPNDGITNTTTNNITFGYTPTAYGTTLRNATLWTNESGWARAKLNLTAIINASLNTIQHNFTSYGTYLWTISVWDSNGEDFTVNRTLTIEEPETLTSSGGCYDVIGGWGYCNITNGTMRDNQKEYQKYAPAIAIGDADNDGFNETIVGYANMTNELRMYKYNGSAWIESNISDVPSTISAVAIGDMDKDGKNSIMIGMRSLFGADITSSLREYKANTTPLGWSYGANLVQNPNFTDTRPENASLPADWYQQFYNDCSLIGDDPPWNDSQVDYIVSDYVNYTGGITADLFSYPLFLQANKTYYLSFDFFQYEPFDGNGQFVIFENDSLCSEPMVGDYIQWNTSYAQEYAGTAYSSLAITPIGDGWYRLTGLLSTSEWADDEYIRLVFSWTITTGRYSLDNVVLKEATWGSWTEVNITAIDSNVTAIAYNDVNNNGFMDITVGYDQFTYNNTRFYENKSGGWVEQNISDNYGYKVVVLDVGRTRATTRNKTIIGLDGAVNAIRKYENMTGKWVETNISSTAIFNGSTPCFPSALKIGDADNDGFNDLIFSEVHSALGIYYSSMYRFYNPAGDIWNGVLILGGITAPFGPMEIGKVSGMANNSIYFSVNTLDLRKLELVNANWVMSIISSGELIDYNAFRIGNADNSGGNEIYAATTTLGDPYNKYRILEYHYTAPATGGGVSYASNYQCVNLDDKYEVCLQGTQKYFCLNIGGNKQCVTI